MLDAGLHPAYVGVSSLPFFDEIDPKEVDLLLVTHFHLDHAAALPYFLQKTEFSGKCYMTYPTKAIYKLILQVCVAGGLAAQVQRGLAFVRPCACACACSAGVHADSPLRVVCCFSCPVSRVPCPRCCRTTSKCLI